jgi:hypothetical protein
VLNAHGGDISTKQEEVGLGYRGKTMQKIQTTRTSESDGPTVAMRKIGDMGANAHVAKNEIPSIDFSERIWRLVYIRLSHPRFGDRIRMSITSILLVIEGRILRMRDTRSSFARSCTSELARLEQA